MAHHAYSEEGTRISDEQLETIIERLANSGGRQKPPDLFTQLRQWVGLVIASGGVLWLVSVGKEIGHIESAIASTREELRTFVAETRSVNKSLSDILRTIEQRTATLEGMDRERSRRRNDDPG